MGIETSWVSRFQPLGKSGRSGRSIMRAVRVAFSPALPSRRKKLPGIFPAAYMRSSTSTVRGRKSTSRAAPAVAVHRTRVSPASTTTEPLACLAYLPVSKLIELPPISRETRLTPSFMSVLSAAAQAWLAGRRNLAASGWRQSFVRSVANPSDSSNRLPLGPATTTSATAGFGSPRAGRGSAACHGRRIPDEPSGSPPPGFRRTASRSPPEPYTDPGRVRHGPGPGIGGGRDDGLTGGLAVRVGLVPNCASSSMPLGRYQGLERTPSRKLASGTPGCGAPRTNCVGVVVTPARIPDRKSRSTRSATSSDRRSASKRWRSRPRRLARSHRCGSSRCPWSSSSESCISQNLPCLAAASAAAARTRARGCFDTTGKCRNTRVTGSSLRIRCAFAQYGHSRSAYSTTTGPSPRLWSAGPGSGGGALLQRVKDEVRPRHLERRRQVGPLDRSVWADHHERAAGHAVVLGPDAVGLRHLALRVEVGEQRDREPAVLLEGPVAEGAVDR